MSEEQQTTSTNGAPVIVARAGRYYRNARYIMFSIIVVMGCWFLYDGFVKYPADNKAFAETEAQIRPLREQEARAQVQGKKFDNEAELQRLVFQLKNERRKHDDFGITVQKILGFALPPIGIGLMIYWLRCSRGEIRLENKILTAPGHSPAPLAQIDDLDKALWEKKGIAFVFFTLPNGTTDKICLDDFVYQARPIREIVKAIEAEIAAQDALIAKARAAKEQQAVA